MKYIPRVADKLIDIKSQAFCALNIVGPKGCGKTRTATERCKTVIEFQDEEKRDAYLSVAETSPRLFFKNKRPILFDEWQDAPKIWGAVRKECDDFPEAPGEFFLTGSTSKRPDTPHTGTGRIAQVQMYPMTLWETSESEGNISLYNLLDSHYDCDGAVSKIKLEDLFFAVCRGGWPRCLALKSDKAKLEIAKDYCHQIYSRDMSSIDGTARNESVGRTLLWSYARNMATLAKKKTVYTDVQSTQNISEATLSSYITVLRDLFVICDIDAWMPQLRSKTAIRASKKHIFIDPSIGLAALGVSPEYFNNDLDLFGHAFENMVLRDLLAYAQVHDGKVMHYRDDMGLEIDAIYRLSDGRYALIEIKTGNSFIPAAEKNLLKFKTLIQKHNDKALTDKDHPGTLYAEPSAMIIICANAPLSYTTENGVKVVPYGCLRE